MSSWRNEPGGGHPGSGKKEAFWTWLAEAADRYRQAVVMNAKKLGLGRSLGRP